MVYIFSEKAVIFRAVGNVMYVDSSRQSSSLEKETVTNGFKLLLFLSLP